MNQISKFIICLAVLFASVSAFQPIAKHSGFSLRLSAVKKAEGKATSKPSAVVTAAASKKAPAAKNVDAFSDIFLF